MIRTYNRQPISVNTPDEKNIREYFTNQMEWKGLNDDKNFVTVDQNSYQDCNNIYVDAEGLLRSRPAIKKIIDNGEDANVIEYYTFSNCSVYRIVEPTSEYYSFVSDIGGDTLNVEHGTEYKLVEANNKIYVIGEDMFAYYDTNTFTVVENATGDIYIPEREIYGDGVLTDNGESPNLLTDSYYKTYIYTGIGDPNYALFLNKDIDVKIDNETYHITGFKKNQEYTFVKNITTLSDSNFAQGGFAPTGYTTERHFFMSVGSNGAMIVSDYTDTAMPTTTPVTPWTPRIVWNIYYSPTGKVFTKLPTLLDILGEPKLSQDGAHVFCITKTGIYAISVLKTYYDAAADTYTYKYPVWKQILELTDINNVSGTTAYYKQDVSVNGEFINDENYAISYGTMPQQARNAGYPAYANCKVVVCRDSVVKTSTFTPVEANMLYGGYQTAIVTGNWADKFAVMFTMNGEEDGVRLGETRLLTLDASLTLVKSVSTNVDSNTSAGIFLGTDAVLVGTGIFEGNPYYNYNLTEAHRFVYNGGTYSTIPTKLLSDRYAFGANGYLYTNTALYTTTNWTDIVEVLQTATERFTIPNLKSYFVPIIFNNSIYYFNEEDYGVYIATNTLTIKEFVDNGFNLITFDKVSKLDNFFVAIGNRTYINSATGEDFKWYLPLSSENIFDSKITNLHPISSTEMAIFLKDAIYYTLWDNDLRTYRYVKSKIQVGCREGCDVITTFDGKFVIFTSARGLVAMNYQDFVASTDQTLSYISDTIYQLFYDYIVEPDSQVKLYKFGYWLVVYKNNSLNGFIFDLRNSTWWPFSSFKHIEKIVTENDKPKLLVGTSLYKLDTSDTNYYDFDGTTTYDIPWFLLSQKLYLGALNYYKHIVNLTFESVHDVTSLEQNDYNINELDFKLQVNNYRKTINGTVDTDEYDSVNYVVNSARTFVQRVNYSKVNEFQYKLSYDADAAYKLPLSLAAMSVKYKVGGKIR